MSEIITLTGISEYGRHGVYPHEKQNKQNFIVDLILDVKRISEADQLETTVDYGVLSGAVREIVASTEFDLIESLAAAIAAYCIQNQLIHKVTVIVHKPEAAKSLGITDVSVSVTKLKQ
jgi:dihydroneopterin aldolase